MSGNTMNLQPLDATFAVCKLSSVENVDLTRPFVFLSKTDEEISLVCEDTHIPPGTTHVEPGWKGLRIAGTLDFGMVGVLARLADLLARHAVSIFVISTYNTDYLLVKAAQYEKAVSLLREDGYHIG